MNRALTYKQIICINICLLCLLGLILVFSTTVEAASTVPFPSLKMEVGASENPQDVSVSLQILFLLTILSLAPGILVMMTSFTRTIIVLSFVRHSMSMPTMPPNQVLIGLALFITFFIMAPTWNKVNNDALQPYLKGQITQEVALVKAAEPVRQFMLRETREKDLALFVRLAELQRPKTYNDIPTYVLVPAFAISELKTAFIMGFIIFIPFIVIDMVVASSLMSMGMLMLPPMMISLPFKILLFVIVDGWHLVIRSIVMGFK